MPVVLYIYDALCGWCYGFSPVMARLEAEYKDRVAFNVLSGGMVPREFAQPLVQKAGYIAQAYKTVEEYTGVTFGEAYLEHIFHPEQSPWIEESLTPATALCLLKAGDGRAAVSAAAAIQRLHMVEGKDLSDGNTYLPLAASLNLDPEDFLLRLQSEEWQEEARYEFALVKQLGVSGFPAVLLQSAPDKFYLVARGYTPYDDLAGRLERIFHELQIKGM